MRKLLLLLLLLTTPQANVRGIWQFTDSIIRKYHIPELGYAIVSGDSIYDRS